MARDNGIKKNGTLKKVEPLITPKQLKERYLFGVQIVDNDGNELSDQTLQVYIANAVSMLEHFLDISIVPETLTEPKDYRANDYWEWGYMLLDNVPVQEVSKVAVVYLETTGGQAEVAVEFPKEWYRVEKHHGILRFVPNNKFPANLQIGGAGNFFPELFRRHGNVPHLWRVTYTHGFKDGEIPMAISQSIGYIAAIQALNIAGDLIIGAGIASESLSLDGLSQAITTTSSAENHGYSAKVKEFQRILFGANKDDPSALLKMLKSYYQGEVLNIV